MFQVINRKEYGVLYKGQKMLWAALGYKEISLKIALSVCCFTHHCYILSLYLVFFHHNCNKVIILFFKHTIYMYVSHFYVSSNYNKANHYLISLLVYYLSFLKGNTPTKTRLYPSVWCCIPRPKVLVIEYFLSKDLLNEWIKE